MSAQATQIFPLQSPENTWRDEIFKFLNNKLDEIVFHPGGHLLSPTCGHLFFPHPSCHLAGMKKRIDQYMQLVIRHPRLKSDS